MMPVEVIAGTDSLLLYSRTAADGTPLEDFTVTEVSAELDGVSVGELAPEEGEDGWSVTIPAEGLTGAGTLVITWQGTNGDGTMFTDVEEAMVLLNDSANAGLLARVRNYIRCSPDDPTIAPLVAAAIGYVEGAGAVRPAAEEKLALWEQAVTLHVAMAYGGERKLESAMNAIILQLRE